MHDFWSSISTEPSLENWLKLNSEYASLWPNISVKREPPADAKQFDGVPNKLGAVLLAKCRSGEHVGDSRSAKNYPISSERPSHGQLRLSLHMRAELYDNE